MSGWGLQNSEISASIGPMWSRKELHFSLLYCPLSRIPNATGEVSTYSSSWIRRQNSTSRRKWIGRTVPACRWHLSTLQDMWKTFEEHSTQLDLGCQHAGIQFSSVNFFSTWRLHVAWMYIECAHEQHVRRTLTLTLTHTITAYSVSGNVVRLRILICATRQKPCRKGVYHFPHQGIAT